VAEDSRVQPFEHPGNQPPGDHASSDHSPADADERRARQQWAQTDSTDATLRLGQARRLIARRPLLKGVAAGAALLIVSPEDLQAALRGQAATVAEAAAGAVPDPVKLLQCPTFRPPPTSPPPTMPPPTRPPGTSPPPTMPPPGSSSDSDIQQAIDEIMDALDQAGDDLSDVMENIRQILTNQRADDLPPNASNVLPGKGHPEISGVVRLIQLDLPPPFIVVGTARGNVIVLLTTAGVAYARNSLNVGDMVTAVGTREGENTLEDADLQPYK
jgi:hypothetical protein